MRRLVSIEQTPATGARQVILRGINFERDGWHVITQTG
jgi:hypothetical protein